MERSQLSSTSGFLPPNLEVLVICLIHCGSSKGRLLKALIDLVDQTPCLLPPSLKRIRLECSLNFFLKDQSDTLYDFISRCKQNGVEAWIIWRDFRQDKGLDHNLYMEHAGNYESCANFDERIWGAHRYSKGSTTAQDGAAWAHPTFVYLLPRTQLNEVWIPWRTEESE